MRTVAKQYPALVGHVALYCRISRDRNGRAEGAEAQEKWGRDYAAGAWPDAPVVVYADNDISASNGDHRPGYEELRREVGWFELAAELLSAGITSLHTNRDGIVRIGDEIAGIKAVLNAGEVRKLTRRINDRLAENAAGGTPPGSVPFGYRHGVNDAGDKTYVIVPGQADAIRWAAQKVLAGWSLSKVKAGLCVHGPHRVKIRNAAGEVVTDAQGNSRTRTTALTAGSVRSMLTSPSIARWRVHQGRVVGRGNWSPILDEATWQACRRARFSGPRTVTRSDGGAYPVTSRHTGYSAASTC